MSALSLVCSIASHFSFLPYSLVYAMSNAGILSPSFQTKSWWSCCSQSPLTPSLIIYTVAVDKLIPLVVGKKKKAQVRDNICAVVVCNIIFPLVLPASNIWLRSLPVLLSNWVVEVMWCSTYLPVGEDNRIHPGVEKYISLLVLNPVISEDSALRIQKIPSIYLHKLGPLKKGESLYSPVRTQYQGSPGNNC